MPFMSLLAPPAVRLGVLFGVRPLIVGLLLLTLSLFSSACATKTITIPPRPIQEKPVQAPAALPDQSLLGQAERAWSAGNMAEAERLYGVVSRSPETPQSQLRTVLERSIQAALANRHAQSALDGLDRLRLADPTAVSNGLWQRQLGQALLLLPATEALRRATGAVNEASMPATLRAQAAAVALLAAPDAEKVPWMEALNNLYQNTTAAERQLMERGLYTLLPGVPGADLADLVNYSLPDTDQAYPWSVFLLEQARREGVRKGAAPTTAGVPAAERLGTDSIFADTALRGEVMGGTFSAGLSGGMASGLVPPVSGEPVSAPPPGMDVPMSSGCVVLALPTSGNYAAVGSRVALGAEMAKQELTARGIKAELVVLNTEDPDWLNRLAALPPQCVMVGGPLTMPAYSAAKAAGALQQRAFFTFTSSLEGNDEGTVAWRFFSSPEDQVSAMLRMAGAVGVDVFGVLYPEEPFGHRMAELFTQGAGSKVVSSAGYSPTDPQSWNGVTKSLVGGHMRGETPVSSARFQGLFLPDSWDKSANLIPFLFFHGEDRLLLMGTALWEQGITRTRLDASNLTLVIFPGGWNSATPTAAALVSSAQAAGQTADSWMGLGYDFVRFALATNLTAMPSPAEVNTRIQSAARMGFSIAPLSWTPDGRARQHMFVFTPTADGNSVELVHPDSLKQRLEQVRARYERRLKTSK